MGSRLVDLLEKVNPQQSLDFTARAPVEDMMEGRGGGGRRERRKKEISSTLQEKTALSELS